MFILRIHFRVMLCCVVSTRRAPANRGSSICVVSQSSSNVVAISVILGITAVEIAHPFEGQLTDVL